MAYTYIIIDKIHSFKLKSNLQKLMQVEGNVFFGKTFVGNQAITLVLTLVRFEISSLTGLVWFYDTRLVGLHMKK